MCGYHWVCGGGKWSSPTTNEVISTYISPDEGGFVFISYKREAYGQTEHQQMPWVFTYYKQCIDKVKNGANFVTSQHIFIL